MGSKISCVDVIKNENKDGARSSGIDCIFDATGAVQGAVFRGTGVIYNNDKGKREIKETKKIIELNRDSLNYDELGEDTLNWIEKRGNSMFGTPKIEIPKNIQGNLNKNRPNFAINSYDPLILDLNGDGKINLINSQTYFDYEGDGIKEAGYWLDKEDGFLDFTRKIA